MPWFSLETDEKIDLEKTLFSGQTFLFKKTGNNEYCGVIGGSIIRFRQVEGVVLYNYHKEVHSMLCKFFNLGLNYRSLVDKWNEKQSHIRFEYSGLRLLRCELVETVFSFICSSNNNIKRITSMVEYLSAKGEFLDEISGFKFYRFPDVEKLVDIEDELRERKFGYRARYVCSAARRLLEVGLRRDMGYTEARDFLMSIDGIGMKVADCICLISLGHLYVVPVDTHVFNMSRKMFKVPEKLTKETYKYIVEKYVEMFGEYAGVAQLFIFKNSLDRQLNRRRER